MILRFNKDHLVPKVVARTKRATLRVRQPRIGETLVLMCGPNKVIPNVRCLRVTPVSVTTQPFAVTSRGRKLRPGKVARLLGHESPAAAAAYYEPLNGPAFEGFIIRW